MREFITGFVAGEGCFTISGRAPSFEIELRQEDEPVLRKIQSNIGVGSITWRHKGPYVKYRVHGIRQCWAVAQYFSNTCWHSSQKGQSFVKWVAALKMLRKKEHITKPEKFKKAVSNINKR